MDPQGEKAEDVWEDVVDAEGCQGWPTLSLVGTRKSGAGGDDVSWGRYWTLLDKEVGNNGKPGSLGSRGK